MQPFPGAFWNTAYGDATYRYGTAPNAFLADQAPRVIAPGSRVLVIGDGEGRNGVWLAEQGHHVLTCDLSEAGPAKARALAAERGVAIEARTGAFPNAVADEAPFDAIVLTYIHLLPTVRTVVHEAVVEALAPGGVVILEAFRPAQRALGRTSGGPPDPAMMFTEDQLAQDFASLQTLHRSSPSETLSEGHGHAGLAELVRWVARKA